MKSSRFLITTAAVCALAGAAWGLEQSEPATKVEPTSAIRAEVEPASIPAEPAATAPAKEGPAKEGTHKDGPIKANRSAKAALPMTPEREAAAITFVTRHHPELAALLKHLKETHAKEYQRAIRELYRTSENLAVVQESDLRRYELDLQAWQLKSRIQLLAARLSMKYNKALEVELRKALVDQIDLRIKQSSLMRERTAARLQELDATLARLNQERDATVERELHRILQDVGAPTGNKAAGATTVSGKNEATKPEKAKKQDKP